MSVFSIQSALLALPQEWGNQAKRRLQQLEEGLAQSSGLHVRDDSRLVWAYALGELPEGWTEQKVIDELCLMQYIHGHTNYTQQYKTTIPVVKQNIEQQIFHGWPNASFHAYAYVQKFVLPVYRIRAMMDRHPDAQFPTQWPWTLLPALEPLPTRHEEEDDGDEDDEDVESEDQDEGEDTDATTDSTDDEDNEHDRQESTIRRMINQWVNDLIREPHAPDADDAEPLQHHYLDEQ